MSRFRHAFPLLFAIVCGCCLALSAQAGSLSWPVRCIPGAGCGDGQLQLGYPDIDGDGQSFDCGKPGYRNHTGTDIVAGSLALEVPVVAAADGEVVWVVDGLADYCATQAGSDCDPARFSRPTGPDLPISLGFNAGNHILIRHKQTPEAYLTLYAHLQRDSILVKVGQQVRRGERLGTIGNSGASLKPHLHFGVYRKVKEKLQLTDPWMGGCGPNTTASLWFHDPPYRADFVVQRVGTGQGVVSSADGRISCGAQCEQPLLPGSQVTLRATPYQGSEFGGWSGACSGSQSTCTVTVDDSVEVQAWFSQVATVTTGSGRQLPVVTPAPLLSSSPKPSVVSSPQPTQAVPAGTPPPPQAPPPVVPATTAAVAPNASR